MKSKVKLNSQIAFRAADWMFLQPQMLDLMHDAVITTDLNGTITGCNRAVSSVYAYTSEELVGQNVTILYAEEDAKMLSKTILPSVLETGLFRGEVRNRTQNGDYIYVHLSVALLRDADGTPTGMVGFSVDVTAQKLGSLAVRRSEEVEREIREHKAWSAKLEMLFAAVERAEDVFVITEAEPIDDPGPRILYVNRAFQRLTGYTPEEVLGKTQRILHGPRTDEIVLQRIRTALTRCQPIREELINYRKDGSEFWVDVSMFPIADEKGKYTHWMTIQRDTTVQNEIREKLLDGESRQRFLTETMPQLLWTADSEGRCTYVSRSCAEFLGMESREVLDGGWFSCVHPDDLAITAARWREAVETGTNFSVEYRLRRNDGQYLWFLHRASPRRNESGKIIEWVGTSTDIAMQKHAEEALRQSEKLAAVGRLAASIAHEINNPLSSVTNLLYLMGSHPSLDRVVRAYVRTAQEELARVSEITTQTLRFYKQSTSPAPARVAEIMDSVLSLFRRRILASNLQLKREYERTETLRCLAGEIRQVFGNLIANAVEASPEGGKLTIRIRPMRRFAGRQRLGVRITIADSGKGIAPEHLPHVFEPFFTTKGITGTGLGLWVTKDLVARHDGVISLRSSTRRGRSGTVISIFLPYEASETRE